MDIGIARIGNVSAGNYLDVMQDGTTRLRGNATAYRDMLGQIVSARLDTSTGRLSWDSAELGIKFASNARYPDEPIPMVIQANHDVVLGGTVGPHIHWFQSQAATPNLLLRYRTINNGGAASAWTNVKFTTPAVFTYTAGTILQITPFPSFTIPSGVSGHIDMILYRDSANASGLFSGADPVATDVIVKSFDLHTQVDSFGSDTEYVK